MNRIPAGFFALLFCAIMDSSNLKAATLGWGDGVNLQPAYEQQGDVNLGWALMRQHPEIRSVRIEIEPDVPLPTVRRWLTEAHAAGYPIIATYHNYHFNGSDQVEELLNAAKWWRANYAGLTKVAPLTVNLMNEWGSHKQTPASFSAAYNAAIAIVREVYPGPLIVDIPGWGQETYVARDASALITDQNIVYSAHIYSSGWVEYGARHWMQPDDLNALTECGRPAIIGEFGALRQGKSDWSAIVDRAKAKGWTVLAWAWNGDGEGMNMITPTWAENPSAKEFKASSYFQTVYQKLGAAK